MNGIKVLVPDVPSLAAVMRYLDESPDPTRLSNFGPLSLLLEERLAARLGVPREAVLLVSSGTAALELALDVTSGAETLLPAFTFAATATAAIRNNGRNVWTADVSRESWALTPEQAEEWLDELEFDYGTVVPVCPFGAAYPPGVWSALLDRQSKESWVVIDAANAFGNQKLEVRDCLLYCFSLHCTKSLGAGEGGLIVGEPEVIARLRRMTNFGLDADSGLVVEGQGTNAKLSEYHAAVGLASLDTWDARAQRRRWLNLYYQTLLRERLPAVAPMPRADDGVYTIYPVLLPREFDPLEVSDALLEEGVETRRWYCPPVHWHEALSDSMYDAGTFPNTQELDARLLCLPFHAGVNGPEALRVVEALARALR